MDNILTIGDCIVVELPNNKFAGLILKTIIKTIEYTTYSFILVGRYFEKIPTSQEFLSSKIFGRKIPSGVVDIESIKDGSYIKKGKFVIGYNTRSIDAKYLLKIRSQIHIISNINFSKSNFPSVSSGGSFSDVIELERALKYAYEEIKPLLKDEIPEDTLLTRDFGNDLYPITPIIGTGQDITEKKIIEYWILSKKIAHPRALELFNEDFFWSQGDEFSPFGSDCGSDALHGFQEWSTKNPNSCPIVYLKRLEQVWGLWFNHIYETKPQTLPSYIDNTFFFIYKDQGIIGMCFAQLILYGKASIASIEMAELALRRLLHPSVIKLYKSYNSDRTIKLKKQLKVLRQLKKEVF